MDNEKTQRILSSIGKEIFVKYYEKFKNESINNKTLAEKLLDDNPKATSYNAQIVRVNSARRLIREGRVIDALYFIVDSRKVNPETIAEEKAILKTLE